MDESIIFKDRDGDISDVSHYQDHVYIQNWYTEENKGASVAFDPRTARELAMAILDAADRAEDWAKDWAKNHAAHVAKEETK